MAFFIFDSDGSKTISFQEFWNLLNKINSGTYQYRYI